MIALLDTNALLIPWQFKVDVLDQLTKLGFTPATIQLVIDELMGLKKKGLPGATIALQLASKCDVLESAGGSSVDDALLNTARKNKIAVVTTDKELKSKLRQNNIPVVQLRQMKYLEVDFE